MTVGNFNEVIGTDGFDSIRGEDLSVVYGLDEGDNLNSSLSSPGENPTTILVGGSGDNNYIVWSDSTTFILENSNLPNILYTNIGVSSGISLSDDNSFVAEIDNRHLYLGNTQANQYTIVVDWQLPENQIETFALSEGDLSYTEFADSFRSSSNYRGNFTWAELAATGEIDLARLGLSAEAIDNDFETINARSLELSSGEDTGIFIEGTDENDNLTGDLESETLIGGLGNDSLLGSDGDDLLLGDTAVRNDDLDGGIEIPDTEGGNDTLDGGLGNDTLLGQEGDDLILGGSGDDNLNGGIFTSTSFSGTLEDIPELEGVVGGRDTLEGGEGWDSYGTSLDFSGGSVISDSSGEFDDLYIEDYSTNTEALRTSLDPEVFSDPATYGNAAVELSLPQSGIVGLHKSGTELIIDLNRDGVAESADDLTVSNFFDAEGNAGSGFIEFINNLDSQEIVTFFAENSSEILEGSTVYRFFNNDTGVHFYTANETERSAVEDLPNYSFEGASYTGADPLTGSSEASPVYRFLNQDTGVHLYTISEIEREAVQELGNFSFEGEAFSAYETQIEGSIPIYRFYNSTTGAHFYTPSATERDNVENNLADYQSEGVAYFALPVDTEVI